MGVRVEVRDKYGVITSAISVSNNAAGEYQLKDLIQGRYALFAFSRGDINYYSDSTPLEVVNKDLEGVDIKVLPGATISGQVVVEGASNPALLARLTKTVVWVMVGSPPEDRDIGPLNLNSDGTLRIQGLPAGKAQLRLHPIYPAQGEFSIQRLEINGMIPTDGVELKSGEQVTGVRLVLAHGTGTLHGRLKVRGGELPTGTRFRVNARQIALGAMGYFSQVEADMRSGQFFFDNLPVGNYGISLLPIFPPAFYENRPHRRYPPPQQSVTVTEGSQAEVTLVFDLQSEQKVESP